MTDKDVIQIMEDFSNRDADNRYGIRISETKNGDKLVLFNYYSFVSNNFEIIALRADEFGDLMNVGACSAIINEKSIKISDINAYEINVGIGSAMLRYFMFLVASYPELGESVILEATNNYNRGFYESFGFEPTSIMRHYRNIRGFTDMKYDIAGDDPEMYVKDDEYEFDSSVMDSAKADYEERIKE